MLFAIVAAQMVVAQLAAAQSPPVNRSPSLTPSDSGPRLDSASQLQEQSPGSANPADPPSLDRENVAVPPTHPNAPNSNQLPNASYPTSKPAVSPSQPRAVALVNEVMERLAYGPAFTAQVRQRVWAAGENLVGTGEYTQSGSGSGRFHLFVTVHDGTGKHTLRQISDGRLTWTRSQIGATVQLKRVDVGWLEEGIRASGGTQEIGTSGRPITPRMKIGAWTEFLDQLKKDYVLSIGKTELNSRPLYVVSGRLNDAKRADIKSFSSDGSWPELYPSRVNVVVAMSNDPKTGFGAGLPIQIRCWSDPIPDGTDSKGNDQNDSRRDGGNANPSGNGKKRPSISKNGRMISMIEIYDPQPIRPPDVDYFRFTNDDATIDIINETATYEKRFGIRVSAQQRARQQW